MLPGNRVGSISSICEETPETLPIMIPPKFLFVSVLCISTICSCVSEPPPRSEITGGVALYPNTPVINAYKGDPKPNSELAYVESVDAFIRVERVDGFNDTLADTAAERLNLKKTAGFKLWILPGKRTLTLEYSASLGNASISTGWMKVTFDADKGKKYRINYREFDSRFIPWVERIEEDGSAVIVSDNIKKLDALFQSATGEENSFSSKLTADRGLLLEDQTP